MGIVNVTPDSFSDGGRFCDRERALATHGDARRRRRSDRHRRRSTRPGAHAVDEATSSRA
jgi:dihydropteroate synthase